MPVSTRSQVINSQKRNEDERNKARTDQEECLMAHQKRNPHHGLKEKMKALTLLYEQQKQAASGVGFKNLEPRFSTHPSIDLISSVRKDEKEEKRSNPISHVNVMREKGNVMPSSAVVTRTYVMMPPASMPEDAKENMAVGDGAERVVGFSCPRKGNLSSAVARKLSMDNSALPQSQTEPRAATKKEIGQDLESISETNTNCCGAGNSRILVFVRLRPMNKKEREAGSRCCVKIVNKRDVYLTEFATENDYLRLKRLRGRHFTFDSSFPDSTTQQEVYTTTTAELVEDVLLGKNGSVFCYGATGAGKTYTMLGTVENPGVMVLAIKDLFNKIRQRSFDGNHVVHLSYLEVYNETVRDLLSPGRPLVLREDKQGIVAAGLTQYQAYSTDEVMSLLQQGNCNRSTEPTRVNETSSRSHAILQVIVEYKARDGSGNIVNRVGKLSLIDLAGSERALATDQRTLRSLEGANINRSLLALSSCINALVEGKKHIPYRNSKLTQLLKDSLGGSCNTVMIANISPSNLSFGETQNTLHWADRAKEIRTKASDANEEIEVPESEVDQAKLLLELQKENRELRMQLARQHQKLLTFRTQTLAANSSPTPSTPSAAFLSPAAAPSPSAQPNEKRKPRSSLLTGNCFTPESKKRGGVDDETVKELRKTVKALEMEMQKMKKDHVLQIKHKDDLIRELSRKGAKLVAAGAGVEGVTKVVTRASLRPKDPPKGELKSPSHRFLSPAPTAKKRSFWDITTANSPSVTTANGRKTKSHVIVEPPPPAAAAPSMLLQPGFTRQRSEISKIR